jgi:hypothetical protein
VVRRDTRICVEAVLWGAPTPNASYSSWVSRKGASWAAVSR